MANDLRLLRELRRIPDGPWSLVETDTRIAIKAGRRTLAYIQLADNDYELATAIAALPEVLDALKRCVKDGDLPGGVDMQARSVLIKAGVL